MADAKQPACGLQVQGSGRQDTPVTDTAAAGAQLLGQDDHHAGAGTQCDGTTPHRSDKAESTSPTTTEETHLTLPDRSTPSPGAPLKISLTHAHTGEGIVSKPEEMGARNDMAKTSAVPSVHIDLAQLQAGAEAGSDRWHSTDIE